MIYESEKDVLQRMCPGLKLFSFEKNSCNMMFDRIPARTNLWLPAGHWSAHIRKKAQLGVKVV